VKVHEYVAPISIATEDEESNNYQGHLAKYVNVSDHAAFTLGDTHVRHVTIHQAPEAAKGLNAATFLSHI
jgi:hypothetical protein